MPKLSKVQKETWFYFIDQATGRRKYSETCIRCRNECKQSYHATVVTCPFFQPKR